MERTNSKHGPELDEQMKKETADITHGSPTPSRAEEYRQLEPVEDEEVAPSTIMPPALESEAQGGLTHEEINKRTTLASFLDQCIFPADTQTLLQSASDNNAGDWIMSELGRLPKSGQFENVQAVWEALGGSEEQRF